ncbi:hypothetical protein CDAR_217971 [Caerostris darwini]|uniref:Uncharacterized protein n=1 Tax=Caerostris darwini TaxID=1538125 RepID=A0AAV4TK50_9ARAC|nr:hypothetical protein CDAR_217971 [Caerostris darwini]
MKKQKRGKRSAKTSTPISRIQDNVLLSFKQVSMMNPTSRKKKYMNSFYSFFGAKKLKAIKGTNPTSSIHQSLSEISGSESSKGILERESSSFSNLFLRRTSEKFSTSTLNSVFKNRNKISDISPIYPDPCLVQKYKNQNDSIEYLNSSKNAVSHRNALRGNSQSFQFKDTPIKLAVTKPIRNESSTLANKNVAQPKESSVNFLKLSTQGKMANTEDFITRDNSPLREKRVSDMKSTHAMNRKPHGKRTALNSKEFVKWCKQKNLSLTNLYSLHKSNNLNFEETSISKETSSQQTDCNKNFEVHSKTALNKKQLINSRKNFKGIHQKLKNIKEQTKIYLRNDIKNKIPQHFSRNKIDDTFSHVKKIPGETDLEETNYENLIEDKITALVTERGKRRNLLEVSKGKIQPQTKSKQNNTKKILNANVIKKFNNVCNTSLISKNEEEPPTLSPSNVKNNFVNSNTPCLEMSKKGESILENKHIISEILLDDKIILGSDENKPTGKNNLTENQIKYSVAKRKPKIKPLKISKRKIQSQTKLQQNGINKILNANVIKKLNNVCNTQLISKNQEEPPSLSISGAEDNFVTSNTPCNKEERILKNEDIFSENLLNDKIILESDENKPNEKNNLTENRIKYSAAKRQPKIKTSKVSKRKIQSQTKSQQNGTKKILKTNVIKKSNNNHKSSLISKSVEPDTNDDNLKTLRLNQSNEVTSFLKNNSITFKDLMNDEITTENDTHNLTKDQIEVSGSGKEFKVPKVSKRKSQSRTESKQKNSNNILNTGDLLDETFSYPSTSTPFDSPLAETRVMPSIFQCLSPVIEEEPKTNNGFYDNEPSVFHADRTYSKCTTSSISKAERLWSSLMTTTSLNTLAESQSIVENVEEQDARCIQEKHEECLQEVELFVTPPSKSFSRSSCRNKSKQNEPKKRCSSNKSSKLSIGKQKEKSANYKLITKEDKRSTREISMKHFEEISEWTFCIEKETKHSFANR